MILNLDQLQQQLDQGESSKIGSMAALCVLNKQLQAFIDSKYTSDYDYDSQLTLKCFAVHTGIEVDTFRDTLLLLMGNVKTFIEERAQHRLLVDDKVKASLVKSCDGIDDSGKALDVGSDVTICKGSETDKLDTTSCSVTPVTRGMDADFSTVNEQGSCTEVSLNVQNNVLTNEREHTDQIKLSYDTNLLEKTDSNTMSNSTNMSHKGGESDQDAERDDVTSSLCTADAFKSDNMVDMVDKQAFNELSKRFSQLEKHCISLEIAMQQKEESFQMNQPCKDPELPDFREYFMINDLKAQLDAKNLTINNLKKRITELCDMCDDVKAKHECAVIESENVAAKLIKENDVLKTKLIEKGFTIAALKNELRRATGNSVNTKFAKPSILGKPVRQPSAFRSERTKFSKTRFASQVDAEQVLTKPVTSPYLPKIIASSSAKPHHVATPAPCSSRISSKTVPKPYIKVQNAYDIYDLQKNYDLEKARKRALLHKDGILGSQPGMMPPRLLRNTAKAQPAMTRIYNKSFTMHKRQNKPKTSPRWIQNAKSLETRIIDTPSTMHKKISNSRPCQKWIPTGRIFKYVGFKWIPTGKVLTYGNAMVDRETPKGLDTNVTNPYICNQACNVSAGSPYSVAGTSNIHHIRRHKVCRPKPPLQSSSHTPPLTNPPPNKAHQSKNAPHKQVR